MRQLAKGCFGPDVNLCQRALNHQYPIIPLLKEDGKFGNATEARVKAYQSANGLPMAGQIGPLTQKLLLNQASIFLYVGMYYGELPVTYVRKAPGITLAAEPGLKVGGGIPVGDSSDPPMKLHNFQIQSGGTYTLAPLAGHGKPDTQLGLTMQLTWMQKRDGARSELAVGATGGVPVGPDANGWTFSPFVSVTGADMITSGPFSFFQPSLQIQWQQQFGPSPAGSLVWSAGNELEWTLIKDRLSLSLQGSLSFVANMKTGEMAVGPSVMMGVTGQFWFLGK